MSLRHPVIFDSQRECEYYVNEGEGWLRCEWGWGMTQMWMIDDFYMNDMWMGVVNDS